MPFALIAAIAIGPAVRHAKPLPKQDALAPDPLTVMVGRRVPESVEGQREPTTAFFVETLMAGSTPGGDSQPSEVAPLSPRSSRSILLIQLWRRN
jgi:hypothetical protein